MVGLLYRVIVTEKTRIKSNFTEKIISRLYLVTNIRSEMAVVVGVNETAAVGGAADQWEIPKVRNVMGALLIPILLVLGCSEQFSKSL